MKYLFLVDLIDYETEEDFFEYYQIQSAYNNDIKLNINNEIVYKVYSKHIYDYILELINDNKRVMIPKEITSNHLTKEDILIFDKEEDINSIEHFKWMKSYQIRDLMFNVYINKASICDLFEFININNYFINKKIQVDLLDTDMNDQYMDIITEAINTNNTELIDALEFFISKQENYSNQIKLFVFYRKTLKDIKEAETEEDIIQLYDAFCQRIYDEI